MPKGRVLFIDDDNFLRKVYQAELSEKGFEVHLAVDGEDGMKQTAEVKPDLIILDLIMPKKNGFEVLTDLRRYKETRGIPVIVLSNLAQSDDQKRALDLGAVDYLVKDNTTLDIIAEKIDYHMNASHPRSGEANGNAPSIVEALTAETAVSGTRTEEGPSPSASRSPKPTQKKDDRGHNFCPNCGFKLDKGAKFCPDCGQQI